MVKVLCFLYRGYWSSTYYLCISKYQEEKRFQKKIKAIFVLTGQVLKMITKSNMDIGYGHWYRTNVFDQAGKQEDDDKFWCNAPLFLQNKYENMKASSFRHDIIACQNKLKIPFPSSLFLAGSISSKLLNGQHRRSSVNCPSFIRHLRISLSSKSIRNNCCTYLERNLF